MRQRKKPSSVFFEPLLVNAINTKISCRQTSIAPNPSSDCAAPKKAPQHAINPSLASHNAQLVRLCQHLSSNPS
ncbi:hypothetical protein L596_011280 [Steinernema carpocapsae]|uniref:Uncharacterized protein n=1 Tax=Steinernema carpocapsae TaxID=34508 RepID=A0A4U5NTV1_STECR|nr:hypothetical protein L596_011280 [Steinernema carpocapsae]